MTNTLLGMFRFSGNEDPLTDIRALAAWVAKQPANDDIAFQEAMVRMLEAMAARQPRITSNRMLAVLELDRVSTPVQSRLLCQFLRPSLSDTVRQRLWHAGDDLSSWFVYTYESLFEASQEFLLAQKAKGVLPGVAARLFHHRWQQSRNGSFRYERWMPAKWQGLHAVFESVFARGLAHVPFALLPDAGRNERCNAEQEYLQTLLVQRINTGNLSVAQIDMATTWLRGWSHALALSPAPLEGPGFWLDLGLGDGLLAHKPHTARGRLLYFDVAPLQVEIGNVLGELAVQSKRAGGPGVQQEAADRLALLQRLQALWQPAATRVARRGERVVTDRTVNVVAGLGEIASALQVAANADGAGRFRRLSPEPTLGTRKTVFDADAELTYANDQARGWKIHDSSDSGCRLVSRTGTAAQQKLGGLLGIREAGDSRWKIGIIRRLKTFSGGQTELGVEIVAQNSLLIAPAPVASRDSGYSVDGIDVSVEGKTFDALYLPPTQRDGQPPQRSMVVPAHDYEERRRFRITVDNAAYTMEFTRALERTKDWVWSGFEVVAPAQ